MNTVTRVRTCEITFLVMSKSIYCTVEIQEIRGDGLVPLYLDNIYQILIYVTCSFQYTMRRASLILLQPWLLMNRGY